MLHHLQRHGIRTTQATAIRTAEFRAFINWATNTKSLTYLAGSCLLIAADTTHVIDWHWCRHETTTAYTHLLTGITALLLVTTEGGQGAQSAIRARWPTTKIQRCLVHVQRTMRRHTNTPAGQTLYRLALKLTRIHDLDTAADWVAHLQEFTTVYRDYLNEKTRLNPHTDPTGR